MKAFMSKKIWILLVSLMFVFLCAQTGVALDNLSLTGVVRSIDKNNGIISLDITSEGCRGLRAFKVPDDARDDLDASLMGKKLQFMIDSSKCERGRIHNIIFEVHS
jgi:hypothetical protein